jgi:acetylornithine/succinyldiaminopimelate/putrescine aminotransferase/predicted amino acid dehydrogenase
VSIDADAAAYGGALKPRVAQMLRAVGLDVTYERAQGDYLWYRDAAGQLCQVTDLVGGYGASFIGHNHPTLVACAQSLLAAQRPFNAQASVRGLAGRLAQRLSDAVGRRTGRSYVTTLASTGTEAVEAAIKHAEMELVDRIDAVATSNARVAREVGMGARSGTAWVGDGTLFAIAVLLGGDRIPDADALFARIAEHNARVFAAEPVFLALTGAFHGKTTGALSITANRTYRTTWRRIGLHAEFIAAGDVGALDAALASAELHYLALRLDPSGELLVEPRVMSNVAAFFIEPIQGEGGVREVPHDFLRAVRERADAAGFALVFDEIQSGMGRAGALLASEASGVRGDYYLLSKALGGGLAKISALLVDRGRYAHEFGYLHSSTFAEDDFASAIALEVLDLLTADDDALLRAAAAKGQRLRQRLLDLQEQYPELIVDVRGRGLMIGVELAAQTESSSRFLHVASEQDLLGYLIAGHLLAQHRIRVITTMSSPRTLRIQPSAFIDEAELDRVVDALEQVLRVLAAGDASILVRHLVGAAEAGGATGTTSVTPAPLRLEVPVTPATRSVVFLGHFLEPSALRSWDPSLAALSDGQCTQLLERTRSVLEPFITHRDRVHSVDGTGVSLTVIALPFTSSQVMDSFRTGEIGWLRTHVDQALELARGENPSVIGFGGYTSIITNNCSDVAEDSAVVTSGNSVTAAAAVTATLAEIERLNLRVVRLGVVGAVGNIGTVLADVFAEHVDSVVLVGRGAGHGRLVRRAEELYAAAWDRLARGATGGIFARLGGSPRLRAVAAAHRGDRQALGRELRAAHIAEVGEARAVIAVATDLSALTTCNVIVSATNAPRHVIGPEHVGTGPVVLCDVATPGDVSPEVARQRPLAVVLKGGLIRLPRGQTVPMQGMALPPGLIYGCLAETILLGLSGQDTSLSFGPLSYDQVRRARDLVEAHGFEFVTHVKPESARPVPQPANANTATTATSPVRALASEPR